jgi:hypothetical protein
MKCRSVYCITTLTVAVLLCTAATAPAFHDGGVGYCDGCHSLHDSESVDPDGNSGSALLKGSDPSSTCLGCHADHNHEYAIFNEISPVRTAGGDFAWLQSRSGQEESGRNHGHNVIAADFGLEEDGILQSAPGGSYPAAGLQCTSCHDPHGKVSGSTEQTAISGSGSYGDTAADSETVAGNFRLLGGVGYTENGRTSGFIYGPPAAVAPPAANGPESDGNHTAYGMGMSEWCANCHVDLLAGESAAGAAKHPAGNGVKLSEQMLARYNSYISTGNLSGNRASAYASQVPFEIGSDDHSRLDPSSTEGPDSTANVMCLTCHRAHASAFANSGRWDFSSTFLATSEPPEDGGYRAWQRQLCAKCHPYD